MSTRGFPLTHLYLHVRFAHQFGNQSQFSYHLFELNPTLELLVLIHYYLSRGYTSTRTWEMNKFDWRYGHINIGLALYNQKNVWYQ